MSDTKSFVVNLPYIQAKGAYNFFFLNTQEIIENTIGNIYLGFETRKENVPFWTNLGIYLPTTPDNKIFATLVGAYSSPDHFEAFIPNSVLLTFRGNQQLNDKFGFGAITRIGVTGMLRTKIDENSTIDRFEAFLNYAFQPTFTSETLNIIAGFSGRMFVTESGDLSQRVMHQIGTTISYKISSYRPEIFIRIPINKSLKYLLENTYGASATIEF